MKRTDRYSYKMIDISAIANKIASDNWEPPTSRRDSWRRKRQNGGFDYTYTDPNKHKTESNSLIPKHVENKIREIESGIYAEEIEHLIAVDDNGVKVLDLTGDNASCTFEGHGHKLEGKWVTHNHPRSTSFSFPDIFLMRMHKAKGMRITSRNYDYQIVFGDNATFDENDIKESYNDADFLVRNNMYDKINKGTVTIAEANATHHHIVWTLVSKRLGFIYERTEHR